MKRPFPVEDVDLMDVINSSTGIKGQVAAEKERTPPPKPFYCLGLSTSEECARGKARVASASGIAINSAPGADEGDIGRVWLLLAHQTHVHT